MGILEFYEGRTARFPIVTGEAEIGGDRSWAQTSIAILCLYWAGHRKADECVPQCTWHGDVTRPKYIEPRRRGPGWALGPRMGRRNAM